MDDQGSCLWTLRRDGRRVSCVVRLLAHGVEVDMIYDDAPVATRAFETGEEALHWAERTRDDRRTRGWE